jgi:GT2 family glycosyltransferase
MSRLVPGLELAASADQQPANPVALPVSIIIPAFGAASQLRACLETLCQHAPRSCEIIIADDATPDDSVSELARSFESKLAVKYVRRQENLGFVENCNEAIRSVLPSGNDVLLLNSDTRVTAGFLEEMWEVLHLHEKHGAVTPRSNNATIFSVPVNGRLQPDESYQLWLRLRPVLPRYQVMPTAVGFCLLLKNIVLRQLGIFDTAYSPGYNEENDLICRMNRHGYSAIAANRAFVFHDESSSFGPRRKALEKRNRELLDERYPEYARRVAEYGRFEIDPVDHFAALWHPHRPRVLFDLFHLPAKHSGTSDFALSLLLHLEPRLQSRCDVAIALSEDAKKFFAPELIGYRLYDAGRQPDAVFDLVFKPCQLFTWPELHRLVRLGVRIAYTHQDIIAVRCGYLSGPGTRILFKTAAQLADRAFTISEFSKADFEAHFNETVPFDVIPHGAHRDPPVSEHRSGHVLVVGNQFQHKAVQQALSALDGVGEIVALGGGEAHPAATRMLASGALSRATISGLYDAAAVVVYPSFYEGFGLPIIDAIARDIPVVALDNAVNREVRSLTGPGLFLVQDHAEMREIVSGFLSGQRAMPQREEPVRSWGDVADDYARSLVDLLDREPNIDLLRRRWSLLTTIDAAHPVGEKPKNRKAER